MFALACAAIFAVIIKFANIAFAFPANHISTPFARKALFILERVRAVFAASSH